MSRRKQGRPQHRRTHDSLEQEKDLLVCGDCQTSFPLHDIVQFIRHKRQCCDKENACSEADLSGRRPGKGEDNNEEVNDTPDQEESDGEEVVEPSSPLEDDDVADVDSKNGDALTEPPDQNSPGDGQKKEWLKNEGRSGRKEEKKSSHFSASSKDARAPFRPRQVADAESNTTHSEPSRFVCETCRSTYTSAWALLQHAQKEHGMKIYTNFAPSSNQRTQPSPSMSPMDLVLASSPQSVGSGGSMSPYPVHAANPFASHFRLPLDTRLSHTNSLAQLSSRNFDYDHINDYRLRPQLLVRGASNLDPTSYSAHVSTLDSPYDFYSMRLKQLASGPGGTQSKPQTSPTTRSLLSNASATVSKTGSASVKASTTSKNASLNSAVVSASKLKSCEFCGKNFRFQSNLVVHRRSHTGEKPYKCPECFHSCTQQSKLKRHMKTHQMKKEGAPANETVSNKDEDEDEDDDDGDEGGDEEDADEECEDENDGMEEGMNDEEIVGIKNTNDGAERSPEPGEVRSVKRIKLEVKSDGEERCSPCQPPGKSGESLVSQVMKNSGLKDIQTYNEAFQAALAESCKCKSEDNGNESASQDGADTTGTSTPRSPRSGIKREVDSEDVAESDPGEQSKRESSSSSVWPPGVEGLTPSGVDSAATPVYIHPHPSWFHADSPVRLFFPGYPPRFSGAHDLTLTSENGVTLSPDSATASSALKSDSPTIAAIYKAGSTTHHSYSRHRSASNASDSPTSNLVLPTSDTNALSTPRKEHRRNDTCEFCGKVFKNCSNLTVHRRSHTGEKPYKCSLCSYACAQSSKLTRHMKTHGRLGKDVFTCKFCNMPFSVPSTLEKHMRKCVENRGERLLAASGGDYSSESNGETSNQLESGTDVY